MKTHEKIDQYLTEEKLDESYQALTELERYKRNLMNWFAEQDEIAENEGATRAQLKLIEVGKGKVESAFGVIATRIKLVEKMMNSL